MDSSQYGNHGTIAGSPTLIDGRFGKALEFNGEDTWVEIPHHDSLTVRQGITVMAWIYTSRYNGPDGVDWQGIIAKGNVPRSYSLYTEAGGGILLSPGSSQVEETSDGQFERNEWQHVVAQIGDGVKRYWINGKSAGSVPFDRLLPGKIDQAPVLIGSTHDTEPPENPDRHFLGLIDEVRVWNRVLSEPEIISQMESGTTDAIVSISPASVKSPAVGEQLMLSLNVTGGENVAGYQMTVKFDPTALKYISSENADYLPEGALAVPGIAKDDTVTLAATSLTDESEGDGTLATLTFEVVSVKPSMVHLLDTLLTSELSINARPRVEGAEITRLDGDVNGDGVVNVQDLVAVTASFGQFGENIAADVTGDGIVNIADLVFVAGNLGESTGAPSVWHGELEAPLTKANLQQWLREARQINLTDPTFQRGIFALEQLLAAVTPKETVLLPNYPNPFNPETWIPYRLAEPTAVSISIYSIDGHLVRTLTLGYQPMGIYESRSRAAYWDGKNALGESVASGLYFYTLTTGDFTATRKMLILK
ncbi:hypothetical protein C6499_15490 [Candidatus Poribacteria bacterium]|nr:MAG: hypothetical protein C6499_15490 [Candidatus Poribacteria bacterium]